MLRKTFLIFSMLLLFCAGFITLGLYLMEIEDHYGDLQEAYFESQNGDLIINKQNQTFGIISKNWRRSNVITKQNKTIRWIYATLLDKINMKSLELKKNLL